MSIRIDYKSYWKKVRELFRISNRGTFLLFLLLAAITWLLGALSKEYIFEIPVTINYQNLPLDRVPATELETELYLTVKGEGSSLFRKYRELSRNDLNIDLKKVGSVERMPVRMLYPQIEEFFSGLEITGIQPDTLMFQFVPAMRKLLPLQARYELSYKDQYGLKELQLKEDTVELHGPTSILEDLEFWDTELIVHQELVEDLAGKIQLSAPPSWNVSMEPSSVEYQIDVDEFTEKSDKVPISAVNLPETTKVILYPSSSQLTYQISIDDYDKIDGAAFTLVADFTGVDLSANELVPLRLDYFPGITQEVKFDPKFVEYIIYK